MLRPAPAAALILGLSCCSAACSGPVTDVRVISDPTGDDHGPGGYTYPSGPDYRRGAFDLREVTLARDGRDIAVTVRFAQPVAVVRDHRLTRDQRLDVFLPTVDLYFDLDLTPGTGENRSLAGRNVRLPPGLGWELAVVLSPIPSRLRQVLGPAPSRVSVRVLDRVRVVGDSLRARFPAAALGGRSPEEVGVAVAVTGTVYATTFRSLVEDMVPTAYVREVTEEAGRCDRWDEDADGTPCTFGGCTHCGTHPRVIDALHPERGRQEEALGSRDPAFGGIAQLPLLLPEGRDEAPQVQRIDVSVAVSDRRGGIVTTLLGEAPAPEVGALLEGADGDGVAVATLVVASVHQGGLLVLRVVDGDPERVVAVRWTTWRAPEVPSKGP